MENKEEKKFISILADGMEKLNEQSWKGILSSFKKGLLAIIKVPMYLVIMPIIRLIVIIGYKIDKRLKVNPGAVWALSVGSLGFLLIITFVAYRVAVKGSSDRVDEKVIENVEKQKAYWYSQGYKDGQVLERAKHQDDIKKVQQPQQTVEPKKYWPKKKTTDTWNNKPAVEQQVNNNPVVEKKKEQPKTVEKEQQPKEEVLP